MAGSQLPTWSRHFQRICKRCLNSPWEPGLRGKVAIVTGASSGIGRATALLFANEGLKVCATARDSEGLKDLEAHMPAGEHMYRVLDLQDVKGCEALVAEVDERYGSIFVLAHIGAYLRRKDLLRSPKRIGMFN